MKSSLLACVSVCGLVSLSLISSDPTFCDFRVKSFFDIVIITYFDGNDDKIRVMMISSKGEKHFSKCFSKTNTKDLRH